jgi:light-regulated signal transduction histidine kinase (bacteriophytochrome)
MVQLKSKNIAVSREFYPMDNIQAILAEPTYFCDRVKLSEFNQVQSYGGLLVLNQDLSGVVVSEVLQNGMVSYMGLRFTASNIPLNVRAMYLKLPVRYIPTTKCSKDSIL